MMNQVKNVKYIYDPVIHADDCRINVVDLNKSKEKKEPLSLS